jgi:hypothetical protein
MGRKAAMSQILKIFSGGQTGADRAALDWALSRKVPCGGWCPKGRKAEDGTIDGKYPLRETASGSYLRRTEWNVKDSDATVIFSISVILTGGSKKTAEFARKHKKPYLHLYAAQADEAPELLQRFVEDGKVQILNVAGPRASKEPNIARFVIPTLDRAFGVERAQAMDERTKQRAIKQNQAVESFRLLNQQRQQQQSPGIDR